MFYNVPLLHKEAHNYPRNRNTVKGIQEYVDRIKVASDAEMKEMMTD